MVLAAFGCALIVNSIHQLAFAFGVADTRMLIANSIITLAIGIFVLALMMKEITGS